MPIISLVKRSSILGMTITVLYHVGVLHLLCAVAVSRMMMRHCMNCVDTLRFHMISGAFSRVYVH